MGQGLYSVRLCVVGTALGMETQMSSAETRNEWAIHHLWGNPSVTLIDGTKSGRLVARRKVNGEWQYRAPSDAESADYIKDDAW